MTLDFEGQHRLGSTHASRRVHDGHRAEQRFRKALMVPIAAAALWMAKSVVIEDTYSRTVNAFSKRSELQRLVKEVKSETGLHLGLKYRRWIESKSTWSALVRPTQENYEHLISSLAAELGSGFRVRHRHTDESTWTTRAQTIVDATLLHLLTTLNPSRAVAVAHVREMDVLNEMSARMESWDAPELQIEGLPPLARSDLLVAAESNRAAVEPVVHTITASRDRAEAIAALIAQPSESFRMGPSLLWRGLAQAAAAFALFESASIAFEKVGDLGLDPKLSWVLAAHYANAGGLRDRAEELLDRARSSPGEDRMIEIVSAALNEDHEAIVRAAGNISSLSPDLVPTVAEAHGALDDLDGQIAVYRQATAGRPEYAGQTLRMCQLILQRIQLGRSSHRRRELLEVKDLAIASRESRREWSGNSSEAVHMACLASVLLHDLPGVLSIGLVPPDGEALAEEASAPEVFHLVAGTALLLKRPDLVRDGILHCEDPYISQILKAQLLTIDSPGDKPAIRASYERAWETARDDVDQFEVQSGLAEIGVWPIPGLQEPSAADEVRANCLHATAEAAQGDLASAIQRMRRFRHQSEGAAMLLVDLLLRDSQDLTAIDTLVSSASRFDNPEHLVAAAHLLFERDSCVEAKSRAGEALALAGENLAVRQASRELLMRIAEIEEDWPAMEALVRALISDAGPTPALRWILTLVLFNQGRMEHAWTAMSSPEMLDPINEQQASAWIFLRNQHPSTGSFAEEMLRLVRIFPDSERLQGQAIMTFWLLDRSTVHVDPSVEADWQMVGETFEARFPSSTHIMRVPLGESYEEMVEALRPYLEPGSRDFEDLMKKAAIPSVPIGMLAVQANRPYGSALLQAAAGCLPTRVPDTTIDAREDAAALAALQGRVIIDASVLNLMSCIPEAWLQALSSFESIQISDLALRDLVETEQGFAGSATRFMGWNAEMGLPLVRETSIEEVMELKERAKWMKEAALGLDEFRSPRDGRLDEGAEVRVGPWLGTLKHARSEGLPLFSDDAGLRLLAEMEGVPSFGTLSLLRVLQQKGVVTADQIDSAIRRLFEKKFVDLPVSIETMTDIATLARWEPCGTSLAVSRQGFWREVPDPVSVYQTFCSSAAREAPATLGVWVFSATLGASARQESGVVTEVACQIVLATADAVKPVPEQFASIVEAARQASSINGGDDPLMVVMGRILDVNSTAGTPATGAMAVANIASALSESDRARVTRLVLGVNDD